MRRALFSALLYIIFCVSYIWVSGHVAAQFANGDIAQLARIERIKGTLFIVVSGAAFFGFSYFNLRRMQTDARTIQKQQQSLLTAERRAIAGMCSASLAHDLNNVLTALGGLVEVLADAQLSAELLPKIRKELAVSIDDLSDMAQRMSNVVKTTIPTARNGTDIAATVRQTVELVRLHPDARQRNFTVDAPAEAQALVNRSLFDQMLFNLLLNAAQATARQGHVEARVTRVNGNIVVQVHDDGPGLPAEHTDRIFEPCYSTRPNGNGLGLLAVSTFTDLHGGTVTTGRSPLGGALFEVRFPAQGNSRPR